MRRRVIQSPVPGILLLVVAALLAVGTLAAYLDGAGGARVDQLLGRAGPPSGSPAASPVVVPPTVAPTPTPLASPIPSTLPLTARAAVVVDAETGQTLFARAADEPLPPASTAKIVTALTVVRHARPEEVVTVAPEDVVDPTQESSMGLQAGDTVTVHDLLVGLLLPSGNDAARALARFVGTRLPGGAGKPPVERFVAEMNAVAAALGMEGTHLVHPAGDDVAGQVVTARGLALAARALLADPALQPIVAMPEAEVRVGGPRARTLHLTNTNALLAEEGVYGVKTGTTPEAGQCLVVAYRGGGRAVIAVLLGSQDRYADARALLGLPPAPTPTPAASPAGTPAP